MRLNILLTLLDQLEKSRQSGLPVLQTKDSRAKTKQDID